MEIATKQMAFSLRFVTRKIVVDLQLIWGKESIFLLVWGEGSWNEKVVSNSRRMDYIGYYPGMGGRCTLSQVKDV